MTDSTPEFKSATLDAWAKAAAKSAPGGNVDALNWITPDGIAVKPLYTAADTADLKHADTLPGSNSRLKMRWRSSSATSSYRGRGASDTAGRASDIKADMRWQSVKKTEK